MRSWSPAEAVPRPGPSDYRDVAVAVAELARARLMMAVKAPDALLEAPPPPLRDRSSPLVARVRLAIDRAARRVPWRSDCLVQALAAQHWLHRAGVDSQLCIGARKPGPSAIDAHAWLIAEGEVVVGGEVGAYAPLFEHRKRP